jgi:uncharacterized SAM-binding protein YcdF (DUF218 family)
MYYLIKALFEPYTLVLLCLAAAVVWQWRASASRRRALLCASLLLGVLYAISTPLAGYLATETLEGAYPPTKPAITADDTIVILTGGQELIDPESDEVRLGPDGLYRALHGLSLYQQAGRCRVIVSGGKVHAATPGPTLAEGMRRFLVQCGIKNEDIVLEDRSATTFENAQYSKAFVPEGGNQRVFLVTDALCMPRAVKCFTAQGVEVVAAPCNHRMQVPFSPQWLLPSSAGIKNVNDAAHEWLGLVWYWLRGRI